MKKYIKHGSATIVPPLCLSQTGDDQCTGCSACANACPRHAIEIRLNCEGFYRPSLRDGLCDECRLCLKRCPVIAVMNSPMRDAQPKEVPEVYAAWSTDEQVHRSSSSGGAFSELARYVLKQGGAVCGCEWGENWTPRHVIVRDWEGIARLRGSKYIPSFVEDHFYREVIDLAKSGTLVLFCGTPCQVAGLNLITPSSEREKLLLVDLVCHGVPSLTSFWRYLDWKFGSRGRLTDFSFRNKEKSVATICAQLENGERYLANVGADPWYRSGMTYHFYLQASCFACRFSAQRHSDISLGDFWGIPNAWHDPLGDSVVLANTVTGKETIAQIGNQRLSVRSSDFDTAARKSGRLRGGSIYPVPRLRALSMLLLVQGQSFAWVYYLCFLPTQFTKRLSAFIQSRSARLFQPLRQLWNSAKCL